ncbi:MAG TPA: FAD-dependent monooxygenase [Candidatus Paceibacterota bacterium]|nr:FAD-dependent monooxygenase [Verrucomicrobiota bacterium]HSA09469.1 FAD-dependent monooxygenase [Candidatus Paceibacterota bacterium]
MREERTEVLVVGAGPVGLLTAILLAEAGIEVKIIDQEERTTARSYACALHPRTLKLLAAMGLAAPVLEQGRRIDTVAFYDGQARQAEVKLSELGGEFPFMVILPQNILEEVLERRLRQAGVAVGWGYRFDDLEYATVGVTAIVEELGATGTGYIVPHWEMVVKQRFPIRAQFLVGADGYGSLVRQRLGITNTRVVGPQFFAAYEFEPETPADGEVRVVLDQPTTNVLWPLPGDRCRWTFQVVKGGGPREFPEKERREARFTQANVDEHIRQYVEKVAKQRAPWFAWGVKQITWCTEVVFEQRVAGQLGRERCWLVGDAAHQTGPVGVQSMNVGMSEAAALTGALRRILREKAPPNLLDAWSREWQEEWRRLLGMTGGLKPRNETSAWVRERRDRILACLPASDQDLARLAGQLRTDGP